MIGYAIYLNGEYALITTDVDYLPMAVGYRIVNALKMNSIG